MIAFCLGIGSVPIFNSIDASMRSECAGKIPGRHPGECYEIDTTEDTFPWETQQAEARDFYREFQIAVAANDRKKVSSMMMYPLRVRYFDDPRGADYRFLNSPAELLRVYDRVFHNTVIDYIRNVDANEVWGNDYFLQTGYGQIGIYCTTHGYCPECNFDFKVKIIASNTIYRDATEDLLGKPLVR
ncbi:MAG: hypothetical protein ABI857_04655 [Acidobacteriota bacterium]